MRVLAVHADLIVLISRFWQTTCTAVRAGDEGFVIDSPVYPDELEAVPEVLEQAGFPVSGLLATHADWDHLLGRIAFPQASLGLRREHGGAPGGRAGAGSARAAGVRRGAVRRRPQAARARRHPVAAGPRASLARAERPRARAASGGRSHRRRDRVLHPLAARLWCAATTSRRSRSRGSRPDGSVEAYLATLERLRALVARAETIVPGHGRPLERADAIRVLDEDVAYLEALVTNGADAPLPAGRRTGAQRRIHAENVERLQRTASQ